MRTALLGIQLISACCLIGLILIQTSKGGLQGGGNDFYRTKRGAERIVFSLTIACAFLFFVLTVTNALWR